MTPERQILELESHLRWQQRRCGIYDNYYEGEQPIRFMAPALAEEFGDRITPLVLNWARLGADAYENRLDVEGFRFPGVPSGDDELWQIWQENDLDEQAQQAHLDSVALSRSYVIVGSPDVPGDVPVITVESPFQVATVRDPRTRRVSAALKRWDDTFENQQWAVLYLPDSTTLYRYVSGKWEQAQAADNHLMGRVPVVPLVNRPRIMRPDGVSEFHDVIPLADAANKMATDMMVSGEYHAMPRRWAFGLKESDFVDEAGNALNAWSRDASTLWANENPDIKVGQFKESDLAVFHNTIKLLAQMAAQQMALPPDWLGFNSSNPASADAIRSSETQLVKRVERKHTFLGGAWEEVMRLSLRIVRGEFVEEAKSLETVWRDPSTPTVAQKADAVMKLAGTVTADGRAVLPLEQARIDLGYTPFQRKEMAEMDRASAMSPVVQQLLAKVTEPTVAPDAVVGG